MQNIYDDPSFFAGYLELRTRRKGLNEVLEQPAIWSLLPDLDGGTILDLGCGFGDFARRAVDSGASKVIGVDISRKMLVRARSLTNDSRISYLHSSIEELDTSLGTFDVVVSSLALHYVENYVGAIESIVSLLKPGGSLVFSVEHPICTASAGQWIRNEDGSAKHWPIDAYQAEGRRSTKWFVDGIVKYHRTLASYVNGLIGSGLRITGLLEPVPVVSVSAAIPELHLHSRRPPFLLLAAVS